MRSVYMDTGGNVWSIRRIGAWFVFLHSDSRLLKIEILFKDDIARLDTLWPEGKPTDPEFGYVGVAIAGCYDDVLIVNRILYAGDSYHSMDAVYKGGVSAFEFSQKFVVLYCFF